MKLDLWSDKGFPEVQNKGFCKGVRTGSISQLQKSKLIFEHEDIIQKLESYIQVNRYSI